MTTLGTRTSFNPCAARHLPEAVKAGTGGARSLTQAVQAAARAVDQNGLVPLAAREAGLAFQPKILLALLTYYYARQTYGSEVIEQLLRGDANFRRLCGNSVPDARVIRRFRTENREALQLCLQTALRFLAEQKVAEGLVTRVNEAQLAEEASRRLIMAMFTDSMEMDREEIHDAAVDLCYLFANRGSRAH